MTIGNQKAIPVDLRDNFNKTGTAHILSINGLHIGIIAASAFFFVFLILKSSEYLMLRFNIIKIAAAAFFMVLISAFIAGMEIPVLRSTLMALIFLIALISGKQTDLLQYACRGRINYSGYFYRKQCLIVLFNFLSWPF